MIFSQRSSTTGTNPTLTVSPNLPYLQRLDHAQVGSEAMMLSSELILQQPIKNLELVCCAWRPFHSHTNQKPSLYMINWWGHDFTAWGSVCLQKFIVTAWHDIEEALFYLSKPADRGKIEEPQGNFSKGKTPSLQVKRLHLLHLFSNYSTAPIVEPGLDFNFYFVLLMNHFRFAIIFLWCLAN